jgi:hypothetical protein
MVDIPASDQILAENRRDIVLEQESLQRGCCVGIAKEGPDPERFLEAPVNASQLGAPEKRILQKECWAIRNPGVCSMVKVHQHSISRGQLLAIPPDESLRRLPGMRHDHGQISLG